MQINLKFSLANLKEESFVVFGVFSSAQKKGKNNQELRADISSLPEEIQKSFNNIKCHKFSASVNQTFYLNNKQGGTILLYGLGEKDKFNNEDLRKSAANLYKTIKSESDSAKIDIQSFLSSSINPCEVEKVVSIIAEALFLTNYRFDKYKSSSETSNNKKSVLKIYLCCDATKSQQAKIKALMKNTKTICDAINVARNFVNEPPNVLHSEYYAKEVIKDIKTSKAIASISTKVLGRKELAKEKMNMFLSVNDGSNHDPKLVELTYTPKSAKAKKNIPHVCFVGKGVTFDSGGYSLKPSSSMINMKFDMAGSATVYAAFKALAELNVNVKVTCLMGLTDNMVNSKATVPDTIVTARNQKTVEILNTDAEGRLVLGDTLTYACDKKPDIVIDVATLTGACLVSLGSEICAVIGNQQESVNQMLQASKNVDEYAWQLPIIKEFSKDMESNIADLKNIGGSRFGGTSKAAAFLQEFISDDVSWMHLDIAGVGDSQSHLPYCPKKGASGIMIRTLVEYVSSLVK